MKGQAALTGTYSQSQASNGNAYVIKSFIFVLCFFVIRVLSRFMADIAVSTNDNRVFEEHEQDAEPGESRRDHPLSIRARRIISSAVTEVRIPWLIDWLIDISNYFSGNLSLRWCMTLYSQILGFDWKFGVGWIAKSCNRCQRAQEFAVGVRAKCLVAAAVLCIGNEESFAGLYGFSLFFPRRKCLLHRTVFLFCIIILDARGRPRRNSTRQFVNQAEDGSSTQSENGLFFYRKDSIPWTTNVMLEIQKSPMNSVLCTGRLLINWIFQLRMVLDWLIDRLIDWLTDWLIDWLTDWLIDWLIDQRVYCSIDFLRDFFGWLIFSLIL